jgi:hypothetical protein
MHWQMFTKIYIWFLKIFFSEVSNKETQETSEAFHEELGVAFIDDEFTG